MLRFARKVSTTCLPLEDFMGLRGHLVELAPLGVPAVVARA
ncbi:hypothetical protein SAMN02745225_00889 [Ferrithrix thermotolerans DSM 19514]|uniref:Uncharacterized protein n=1 Tax=Ferrithrix thermotolerans DSM 19514 TaxID=1121881 RepID=A0A1M4U9U5_9ACTN|nr:hypothetical protein SAMN02745225_00889 [Ferrithrix thermotolerans DSM 19514]